MDIILRQVRGGFRASFGGKTFAKLGKTKEAAIGFLVLANRRKLGVGKVRWDISHEWTRNYVAGKVNRRPSPPNRVDPKELPVVASQEEAKKLELDNFFTGVPLILITSLRYAFRFDHPLTLGRVCERTLEEILAHQTPEIAFGPKKIKYLRQLLKHYGLSLKGEK